MSSLCDFITSQGSPPLIFKNSISEWPASHWTPEVLPEELTDRKFRSKIAPKNTAALWETECIHEDISLQEFVEWNVGKSREDNPLNSYERSTFSCYIDYKYMNDMFADMPDKMKAVDWSCFGLEDSDGSDSTIWVGTDGCYTNCHYDTYGFNLVAQIYGRKRWILFPPSDTEYMYPTRIPYEESSVFSQVDVKRPDLTAFKHFIKSHPYIVTLEPGDVLYVPRHWWHYVECLDTAISINTWVEMDEDKENRVSEAITRFLIGCLMDVKVKGETLKTNPEWINPGEELLDDAVNFQYLQETVYIDKYSCEKCHNLTKFAAFVGKFAISRNSEEETIDKVEKCNQEGQKSKRKNNSEYSFGNKKQKVHDFEKTEKKTSRLLHNSSCKRSVEEVKTISFEAYLREITLNFCDNRGEITHSSSKAYPQKETPQISNDFENFSREQTHKTHSDFNVNSSVNTGVTENLRDIVPPDLEQKVNIDERKCDINHQLIETIGDNLDIGNEDVINRDEKLTFESFARSLLHPDVILKIREVIKSQPY